MSTRSEIYTKHPCPKCGYEMCEQFDDKPGPNGKYICYRDQSKAETPRSEPSRGAPDGIAKLRAARTAWHEKNGVPISQEYADFLTAIGELESERTALLEALKRIRSVVGTSTEAWHIADGAIRKAEQS